MQNFEYSAVDKTRSYQGVGAYARRHGGSQVSYRLLVKRRETPQSFCGSEGKISFQGFKTLFLVSQKIQWKYVAQNCLILVPLWGVHAEGCCTEASTGEDAGLWVQ